MVRNTAVQNYRIRKLVLVMLSDVCAFHCLKKVKFVRMQLMVLVSQQKEPINQLFFVMFDIFFVSALYFVLGVNIIITTFI